MPKNSKLAVPTKSTREPHRQETPHRRAKQIRRIDATKGHPKCRRRLFSD